MKLIRTDWKKPFQVTLTSANQNRLTEHRTLEFHFKLSVLLPTWVWKFNLNIVTGTWNQHQSFTSSGQRMFGLHSNIRRTSQSSSDDESPPSANTGANRVKRALFGPTDHEENLRFVKNELKKARSEASSRWNFDFDSGRPLHGQYDWEEVESSTASRTICNPEKHSLLTAPGPAEKENRVMTSCDRVEAEPLGSGEVSAASRPDARSRVSPEVTQGASGLVTPDPEASPPPGPSAASSDSSSLGARHKTTLSKEKKLTGNITVSSSVCHSQWRRLFFSFYFCLIANRIFLFSRNLPVKKTSV